MSEQGSGAGSYAQAAVHGKLHGNVLDNDKGRTGRTVRGLCRIWRNVNNLPGRLPNVALYPSQVSDATNAPKMARDMAEAGAPVDPNQLYELTGFRPARKASA